MGRDNVEAEITHSYQLAELVTSGVVCFEAGASNVTGER